MVDIYKFGASDGQHDLENVLNSGIQVKTVEITNVELLNLYNTSKKLVSAPGINHVIIPSRIIGVSNGGFDQPLVNPSYLLGSWIIGQFKGFREADRGGLDDLIPQQDGNGDLTDLEPLPVVLPYKNQPLELGGGSPLIGSGILVVTIMYLIIQV